MFQRCSGLGPVLLAAGAALLVSLLIRSFWLTLLLALALIGLGVLLLRRK